MAKITSSIKKEAYLTKILSPSGNVLLSDEPASNGGKDLGLSPPELLASALAACTSATLRMYADRKGWDLQEVKIDIELKFVREENITVIDRKIALIGNLDDTQTARLLSVANACPIHKILSNPIEISTALSESDI
jgi:putative redox protein